MNSPIYVGWGHLASMAAAFKKSWHAQSGKANRRGIAKQVEALRTITERFGLTSDQGLQDIGSLIAEGVFRRYLIDGETVEQDIIHSLPFFQHLQSVIADTLRMENPFGLPSADSLGANTSTSTLWKIEDRITLVSNRLSGFEPFCQFYERMFYLLCGPLFDASPGLITGEDLSDSTIRFDTRLLDILTNVAEALDRAVQIPFAPEFDEYEQTARLQYQLEYNLIIASGGMPGDPMAMRSIKLPSKAPAMDNDHLIQTYLDGTPLARLYDFAVPILLSQKSRFEHHHIVAGSGHGKTQTLQSLILHDLVEVAKGEASIVVIDSQGDLINRLSKLDVFGESGVLADKLVLIDPSDVEYPIALNLFDIGMERINQYSQLDRERMINGVLELYDFVLGSLLDAQMTQKQSVIFRYITRLMLHIPNATIETLRDLLEEGGANRYRQHIDRLQGSARAFFHTEFDSREFVQTKKQVLRRLWGILENQSFERMFLHPRNKLDLYSEMNSGKVILINTAKDLLKEEGTQIFGRFFIAMIAQAAQERSVIAEDTRMPTFVYVDEAQDYFDRNVGVILSQARKYKVGMVLAHQFLGQLDTKLLESVSANTSIKFAGGVSAKDARALASEMRTHADFVEQQQTLQFAAFIRGQTKTALSLTIEPGQMETLPSMSPGAFERLRDHMRERYAVHYSHLGTFDQGSHDQKNDSHATQPQAPNPLPERPKTTSTPASKLTNEPTNWD